MTRFSFIVFNALYIGIIYTILYRLDTKHAGLVAQTTYVVAPYICAIMFMSIFSLVRWFIKQNPDTSREGITFLHAAWLSTLFAFLGYRFVAAGGDITRLFTGLW